MVDKLEEKAHLKGQKVPALPVSGPLDLCGNSPARNRRMDRLSGGRLSEHAAETGPAAVVLGVMTAGCIMTALTHVGINLFA